MEFTDNVLSSRRGTLLVGAGAALIAAIILVVYLKHYRSSVASSNATMSVLVAQNLIQKATPGDIVATGQGFQVRDIQKDQVEVNAISDPGLLRGVAAAHDIFPGQQLQATDFIPLAPGALQGQLYGRLRAISIPIDSAHGMTGQIGAGDHIDIYVGMNVAGAGGAVPAVKLLMQNALILRTADSGATPGTVVIRGTSRQTADLAYAADNGKLWFVLRPATGATTQHLGLVTAGSLLGSTPVK